MADSGRDSRHLAAELLGAHLHRVANLTFRERADDLAAVVHPLLEALHEPLAARGHVLHGASEIRMLGRVRIDDSVERLLETVEAARIEGLDWRLRGAAIAHTLASLRAA